MSNTPETPRNSRYCGAPIPLFRPPPAPAVSERPGEISRRYAPRTSNGEVTVLPYGYAIGVSPLISATSWSLRVPGSRYTPPTPYWYHGV